jgi:hypothetical protein
LRAQCWRCASGNVSVPRKAAPALARQGDTLPGMPKFRLLDTAGSEIAIVDDPRTALSEGDLVRHPDGRSLPVLDVYDEGDGLEGGVNATVVVEEEDGE